MQIGLNCNSPMGIIISDYLLRNPVAGRLL